MKLLGFVLIVIGAICLALAFGMDVSVDAGAFGGRVINVGLMDERQNLLLVSGLVVLVGVILFGFGTARESPSGTDSRKCPFCAESVRIDAIVCRYCSRDLPSIQPVAAVLASRGPATAPGISCFTCKHFRVRDGWLDKLVLDVKRGDCLKHERLTLGHEICADHTQRLSG